jgi:hypothetical protein
VSIEFTPLFVYREQPIQVSTNAEYHYTFRHDYDPQLLAGFDTLTPPYDFDDEVEEHFGQNVAQDDGGDD